MPEQIIRVQCPEKMAFLYEPWRYKVAWGGRGAAKSWSISDYLISYSLTGAWLILCAREVQKSIKESVHRLLGDQIKRRGLESSFTITETSIKSATGSEFIFSGLAHGSRNIKSTEAIDKVWVSEAEKVSDQSWNDLIPTIRKDGSEIIIDFNTQFPDDATYKRFVLTPPPNAFVQKVNYYDNPWFPEVLKQEMETDKARDPKKFRHVWLGEPLGGGRKIWQPFDYRIHVVEHPMEKIAANSTCYMAMDPHSAYYPFCVWVALIPKNTRMRWPEDFYKHIYAEWPTVEDLGGLYHELRHDKQFHGTLTELTRRILAMDGVQWGINIQTRFIDPRYAAGAGGRNWATGTTGIVDMMSRPENGGLLFVSPDYKILDSQRQAILGDMQYNALAPRSSFNEPAFSVSPQCKNMIMSLENHRLMEDSEREDEKYKDASDAMRIAWAGIQQHGWNPADTEGDLYDLSQYTNRLGFG